MSLINFQCLSSVDNAYTSVRKSTVKETVSENKMPYTVTVQPSVIVSKPKPVAVHFALPEKKTEPPKKKTNIFRIKKKSKKKTESLSVNTSNFLSLTTPSTLTSLGYDKRKGCELAKIVTNNSVGFTGNCATYVKLAIQKAGMGNYIMGDAYKCADLLKYHPNYKNNFKEIKTNNLETLPAGCVLVYDKGISGYNRKYGHIEITDGHGNAFSDGMTRNIRPGARVFIPV